MNELEVEEYRDKLNKQIQDIGEFIPVAVPKQDVFVEKSTSTPAYKPESKVSQLARKAADYGVEAKRDIAGTLDRVFDVYESPNAFQVFWVISLLLSIGIFVLSAFFTGYNTIIVSLSAVAMTLLFVGFFGYLIYRPKNISLNPPPKSEKEKYPSAVDTAAATKAFFEQDDE